MDGLAVGVSGRVAAQSARSVGYRGAEAGTVVRDVGGRLQWPQRGRHSTVDQQQPKLRAASRVRHVHQQGPRDSAAGVPAVAAAHQIGASQAAKVP